MVIGLIYFGELFLKEKNLATSKQKKVDATKSLVLNMIGQGE